MDIFMPKIRAIHGEYLSREFPLSSEPLIVGRREENPVVLTHVKVSRNHACFGVKGEVAYVKDLNSANGTLLNGIKMQPGQIRTLVPGDEIRIAGTIFRYFDKDTDLPNFDIPKHKLLSVIAEGGMGVVYRARQTSMERDVAIKVLSSKFSQRKEFVGRFVQEARSAGKLNHPNIIQVHDVGKAGDDYYYFTMELIEGADLGQLMGAPEGLARDTAINACARVADALEYAHQRGIIHRDIKPDNIMISNSGEVKLADLGIAKTIELGVEEDRAQRVLGTPHYMSPEQASGRPVDGRSDLYSLGATLFHLLAGLPIYDSPNSTEVMAQHVRKTPPPLASVAPEVPKAVCAVVDKLLQKNPVDRYQTAGEARDALDKLLGSNEKSASEKSGRQAKILPRKSTGKKASSPLQTAATKNRLPVSPGLAEPGALEILSSGWLRLLIFGVMFCVGYLLASSILPPVREKTVRANPLNERIQQVEKMFREGTHLAEARSMLNAMLLASNDSLLKQYAKTRIKQINRKIKTSRQLAEANVLWVRYQALKKKNPRAYDNLHDLLMGINAAYAGHAKRVDAELDELDAIVKKDLIVLKREVEVLVADKKISPALNLIDTFTKEHPGSPAEEVIAALREEVLLKGAKSFATFRKRIKKYLAENRYGAALAACADYQEKAAVSGKRVEHANLVAAINKKVRNYAKIMTAEIRQALLRFDFLTARVSLTKYRAWLQGTPEQKTYRQQEKLIKKIKALHQQLVEAITNSKPWRVSKDFTSKGLHASTISSADDDTLTVLKKPEGTRVIQWKDRDALKDIDILNILHHYLEAKASPTTKANLASYTGLMVAP